MAPPFNPDVLRERFAELTAQRDAILAQSVPLRETRDAAIAAARAERVTADTAILAIEAPLFDIDQERALITRALNGQTSASSIAPNRRV